MWDNVHDAYVNDRVLSASPLELVCLLYQAAIQSVRDARQYLAEDEIAGRARAISRACEIVTELASSLDHSRGGDISRKLAQLYGYIHGRLIEANLVQSDAPLAEVLGLLATLAEGWEALKTPDTQHAPAVASAPGPWAAASPAQESHVWSL